jgi:hypothetical protein
MVLKTFSIDEEIFKKFSGFCKKRGLIMSKQIEMFMKSLLEE